MVGGGGASTVPTTQLLANPGFEGSSGWQATADVLTMDPEFSFHGTGFAYLAGYNNANDVLYQDVAIPAGATSAILRYWYGVTASDAANLAPGGDKMTVEAVDPATGRVLAALAVHSNAVLNTSWTQSQEIDQ